VVLSFVKTDIKFLNSYVLIKAKHIKYGFVSLILRLLFYYPFLQRMSTPQTGIDWVLVLTYVALIFIGLLAVYTADYDDNHTALLDFSCSYGRQAIWIGFALLAGFVILMIDSQFFTGFAYFIYGMSLLLLMLVLVMGAVISGSKSWIETGFFNIQPSELAKFATCLALAKHLAGVNVTLSTEREHLVTLGIVFVPIMLTLMQGDAGSALVFFSLILVLYREGLSGMFLIMGAIAVALFLLALLFPYLNLGIVLAVAGLGILLFKERLSNPNNIWLYVGVVSVILGVAYYFGTVVLLPLASLAAVAAVIMYFNTKRLAFSLLSIFLICSVYISSVDFAFNRFLKPHQKNRIGVILGLVDDKQGVGYNLNQSKIAIGSGGMWGKGFLQGTQNKGNFVPELRTDFIFCTIGEEFGFMGSLLIVGLYVLLLVRLVQVAERQSSPFSRVYGYGVASILFFHFAINMGMTIGLVPIIGIPLPFLSYGGSALISFTILLFVFIKLDSERSMFLR
jgi:rod shape determining protein RodA